MMPDYTLGDTLDFKFTTRNVDGEPTALTSGAVEVYEDDSLTQITAGETLTADFDSVTGLNNLRVVATAGNGYESGKSYHAVLSAGTVGGTSVIGEVVAQFSIERSPSFGRLGAPAGASIAADLVVIDDFVDELESRLTAARAGYLDNLNGHVAQTGDSFARLGAPAGASVSADIATVDTVVDGIQTDLDNGTDGLGALKALIDTMQALLDHLVLNVTTIATLASQTSFTLTAGSGDDDAYNGMLAVVIDASTAVQIAVGAVSDYTGGTKTVALADDPGVFTMAVGDKIAFVPADIGLRLNVGTPIAGSPLDVLNDLDDRLPASGTLSTFDQTAAMTEGYAADAAAPSHEQMMFMLWAFLHDFGISGTTKTSRKLDNTTAMTHTLDDGTDPTDITRAT